MNKWVPGVIFVIGLVLMIGKIYADGEPGAIPLALILLSAVWYGVARVRGRSRREG